MCGVKIEIYESDEEQATLIGQTISGTNTTDGCNGSYSFVLPAPN